MTQKFYYLVALLTAGPDNIRRNERGATATEYALLVGGIALLMIVGVKAFGGALNTMFDGLAAKLGI